MVTPQPTRAALSSGISPRTLTTELSWATTYGENVPRQHIVPTPWPRAVILCPPASSLPERMRAPNSHRFWWPVEHARHLPHEGMKLSTTGSPSFTEVTPLPTASTYPAPSWPPTIGSGAGRSPVTRCSSEWHIPDAANFTLTSPGSGSARSTSSTLQ